MESKHDVFNMNLLFKGVQFSMLNFRGDFHLFLGIPTSKKPFLPSINGCGSRGLDPRVTNCLHPHLASQPWRKKGRCEFLGFFVKQTRAKVLWYQRSSWGYGFSKKKGRWMRECFTNLNEVAETIRLKK